MHAQATCRLLNDLLHHYSISEDCWDNAPKISPSVTSLGSVGILRLHDAWDGATSWNQVLERLVDLLDAAENSVASGGSGHVVLVSTVSFANVLRGNLHGTLNSVNVHQFCALAAERKSQKLDAAIQPVAPNCADTKDLRPIRLSRGFYQTPFTRSRTRFRPNKFNISASSNKFEKLLVSDENQQRKDRAWPDSGPVGDIPPNFDAQDISSLLVSDARTVYPSEHEGSHMLRTLFRWRNAKAQRDIILVSPTADRQLTLVETEYIPMLGEVETETRHTAPSPAPDTPASLISSISTRPILHLFVGTGSSNMPWLNPSAGSASLQPMRPVAANRSEDLSNDDMTGLVTDPPDMASTPVKRMCRGVATLQTDNTERDRGIQVLVAEHAAEVVCTRLLLGPVVGSVSTTAAVIVVEVSNPVDVVLEATPVHAGLVRDQQRSDPMKEASLYAWLRPILALEDKSSSSMIRVVASASDGHPSALHLTGLCPATRYT